MKRPDLEKLLRWAWSQAVTPAETLVLVDLVMECRSPYAQVAFCVRDFARRRQMDPKTVRRALAKLQDRGLIDDRGKKPMDEYRYMRLYQLNLDEQVGGNHPPSRRGNPHPNSTRDRGNRTPSKPETGESAPQVGGNGTPSSILDGGNYTPPVVNTYTNSLQNTDRGGNLHPISEKDGGNGTPTPALLANLPPNANRDLARLMEIYPPVAGEQSFSQADGEMRERLREGHTTSQMVEGVKRYRAWIEATGTAPQFTMHLKKFIGPDKQFAKPWTVPDQPKPGAKLSSLERSREAYRKAGFFNHE